MRRWTAFAWGCVYLCASTATALSVVGQEPRRGDIEWTAYGHDGQGTKYSPAAQITRGNVGGLVPVWIYRTGDYALGPSMARDETTPLFVDGVLYASTPFGGVRALSGLTGRELWAFDSELDLHGDYGDFTNRGVSTWVDSSRAVNAPCHRRIFVAPVDARLIALDARNGAPCRDFGRGGQVSLNRDLINPPDFKGEYEITSPPAIIDNLVIVGSSVGDNQRANAPSGMVRAFDARTGALRWSWDPIPRDSSQLGYETWRGPSAHHTGAANVWSIISVDPSRHLVFLPVGSASPDFFGGERLGQNLFANSVVALDARTGRLVWHFQAVHHDLWDYDVAAQPVLLTLHHGDREVPALVQATKMGHLFILNRETGEPLFPVEERPVPASVMSGEEAWPTQPFPTLPKPLVPSRFSADSVFGISDTGRAWCREKVAGTRSEGIFTPPSLNGTILFPGNIGGSYWGGVSIDPMRRLAFAPTNRLITRIALIPRASLHEAEMAAGGGVEFANQTGTAYGMRRDHLIAPDGAPCNPPPWGAIAAIDLESGQVKWEIPFGSVRALSSVAGSERWGSPNLGGSMVTASGILFAAGALDQRLHAYDTDTGAELWTGEVPAGVHAAPMTYTDATGRQFVVVAAGGHREIRDRAGDYIVAFALPTVGAVGPSRGTAVAAGRYDGHLVLDRDRYPASWTLHVEGKRATLVLAVNGRIHVEGRGAGRVVGDSLSVDLNWIYPAQHCSGTMHLEGTTANGGAALIGEIKYVDGCDEGEEKVGTFALWRGVRHLSSLSP